MKYRRNSDEINFWAGYADCMLALFMVALLLWILSAGSTAFTSGQRGDEILKMEKQIAEANSKIKRLEDELNDRPDISIIEKLKEQIALLQEQLEGSELEIEELKGKLNDKPPIINLTDDSTKSLNFEEMSAAIEPHFQLLLEKKIFISMQEILERYQSIDTLEFVGHTDGSAISRKGNLDTKLPALLASEASADGLNPGSNVDLGLLRALALKSAWISWSKKRPPEEHLRLAEVEIRCYSAAQSILPEGAQENITAAAYRQADPKARRIEIRFTRLKEGSSNE